MFYALVVHFMGVHCFEQKPEFFWGVSVCVVVERWGMWSQETRWVFYAFFFSFEVMFKEYTSVVRVNAFTSTMRVNV
jgi:hypothetical protein